MSNILGITTEERDYSIVIQTPGLSAAGFVGSFGWGVVDTPILVSNEADLLYYFGKPTDTNFVDWFSAASYLDYSGALYVSRVIDTTDAKNASVGTATLIKNGSHFTAIKPTLTSYFYARYAGELGNSIKVEIADSATYTGWTYEDEFDAAPDNSDGSESILPNANDEIHIIVIDSLGRFTGEPNAILEKFAFVSKAKDAKDSNGSSSYYVNVINQKSQYLYAATTLTGSDVVDPSTTHSPVGSRLIDGKPFVDLDGVYVGTLSGGLSGGIAPSSEYVQGYQDICQLDDTSVNIIFAGGCGGDSNHATVVNAIGVATKNSTIRVGFFSPKVSDVLNVANANTADTNIISTYNAITQKHSYMFMSTGVKMIFDKYNNEYRWIPTNADDAGLWAQTHNNNGKWVSAAGYNRGQYKNVIKLAYNPKEASRLKLYKKGINNIIQERGAVYLMGDKTLQPKNSSFSYAGTRFLFIELKNIIKEASKNNMFEFNDDFTRTQFVNLVEPLLRDIKGNRGLYDYLVVCDETNNTDLIIQDGGFIGDILIKPQFSIQWIKLRFNAVGRSISFEEIAGSQQ